MADIVIVNRGDFTALHAMNEVATEWLAEYLSPDIRRYGDGYVVEPRDLGAIIDDAATDGLEVVYDPYYAS